MEDIQIRELVEFIARCLAEHPEQIVVKEICGHQISVKNYGRPKRISERLSARKAETLTRCAPL